MKTTILQNWDYLKSSKVSLIFITLDASARAEIMNKKKLYLEVWETAQFPFEIS